MARFLLLLLFQLDSHQPPTKAAHADPRRTPFPCLNAATILAALLLAAGCVSGPTRPALVSASGTLLPTPLVAQDELHECSLAALSSLCGYDQVPIPGAKCLDLARRAAEREGLSGAELRRTPEDLGFEVFVFEGTFDRSRASVLNHAVQRRPLLAMTADDKVNHFSLLIGHDPELGNVAKLAGSIPVICKMDTVFALLTPSQVASIRKAFDGN